MKLKKVEGEAKVLSLYAIGSVMAGKHLFFDTLNIKFREQEGLYKFHTNEYSYKGEKYRYILYFISGNFKDPSLLPRQRTVCDAVLFLINPLIENVFEDVADIIHQIALNHPKSLTVLIMQNVFGNLDDLPPHLQELAINNGEMLCDLEQQYNLKLISLNYDLEEIKALESGDPMLNLKFFKIFNNAFYSVIHEVIERSESEEIRDFIEKP
ncbi:MAG: hypothetical protein ACOC35_00535 [Promethearchaeia archaeon]